MEKQEHQEQEKTFLQSTTAKMIMVGLLTLVLIIPLIFVQDLITERSQRQKEVIAETSSKWGESVYFYGPILRIPYKDPITLSNRKRLFFSRTTHQQFEYRN